MGGEGEEGLRGGMIFSAVPDEWVSMEGNGG